MTDTPSELTPSLRWPSIYDNLDAAETNLPAPSRDRITAMLQNVPDRAEIKARMINMAWLADRHPKMDHAAARRNWSAVRIQFAKEALDIDNPNISDTQLFSAIGSELKAEKADEDTGLQLMQALQIAAIAGETDYAAALQQAGGLKVSPRRRDRYSLAANQVFNQMRQRVEDLRPVAAHILQTLAHDYGASDTDSGDSPENVMQNLAGFPKEERALLYQILVGMAETSDINAKGRDKGGEGFWGNVSGFGQQTGESAGRGFVDVLRSHKGFLVDNPRLAHLQSLQQNGGIQLSDGYARREGEGIIDFVDRASFSERGIVDFVGEVVSGKPGKTRQLTETETSELQGALEQNQSLSEVRRELRQIAEGVIDPIKGGNFFTEKMWYPAVRMAPYSLQAFTGPAALPMLVSSTAGMRAEEYMSKGIPASEAQAMGLVSGLVEAPVEWMQARILVGKTGLGKLFEIPADSLKNLAKRAGISMGVGILENNIQEALQDFSPILIQHIGSKLNESIPDIEWGKELEAYGKERIDTFWALLPMVMFGTGVGSMRDARYLRDNNTLLAVGFTPDVVDAIAKAPTDADAMAYVKGLWNDPSARNPASQTAVDARAEMSGKLEDSMSALNDTGARVLRMPDGAFTVTDVRGRHIATGITDSDAAWSIKESADAESTGDPVAVAPGSLQSPAVAAATMPRAAKNFAEAKAAVRPIIGKPIVNLSDGREAVVTSSTLKKMLSQKAVEKSVNPRIHALAVANVDRLFENAELAESHEDQLGSGGLTKIHRYTAPMIVEGDVLGAKITVFEHANGNGDTIYTVEAIDVEKKAPSDPATSGVEHMAEPRTVPMLSEGVENKMREQVARVKSGMDATAKAPKSADYRARADAAAEEIKAALSELIESKIAKHAVAPDKRAIAQAQAKLVRGLADYAFNKFVAELLAATEAIGARLADIHFKYDWDPEFDVIDAIEQQFGGIRSRNSESVKNPGGEYDGLNESFTGPARKLIKREGGERPDVIISDDDFRAMGFKFENTGALYDAVANAVSQRRKAKENQRKGRGLEKEEHRKLRELSDVPLQMSKVMAASVRELGISITDRTRKAVERAGRIATRAVEEWKESDGNVDAAYESIARTANTTDTKPDAKQVIRENTGQTKDKITITAQEAMRRLYAAQARAAKAGARFARSELRAIKRTLSEQVAAALPLAERGKFITAIANIQTPKQLATQLKRLEVAVDEVDKKQAAKSFRKTIASVPGKMRPEYLQKVDAIRNAIDTRKMTDATRRELESLADYLEANPDDHGVPESAINGLRRLDQKTLDSMTADQIREMEASINGYLAANHLKNKLIAGQRMRRLEDIKDGILDNLAKVAKLTKQWQPLRDLGRKLGRDIDPKKDRNLIQQYFGEASARPEQILSEMSDTLKEIIWEGIGVQGHRRELGIIHREQDAVFEKMRKAGMPFGRGATRAENIAFSDWLNEKVDVPAGAMSARMTRGEAIYLYQLSLDPDRRHHMVDRERGIVLPRLNNTDVHKPTHQQLNALPDIIGEAGVALAEAQRETYNGQLRTDLNKEWVDAHFHEVATKTNYTPSHADRTRGHLNIEEMRRRQQAMTTEGRGMFKDRDQTAKSPLSIGDAMEVWDDHLDATAKSIAYLKPARDARTVLADPDIRRAIIDRFGESFFSDYLMGRIVDQSMGLQKPDRGAAEHLMEQFMGRAAVSILSIRAATPLANFAGLPVSATFLNNPANMAKALPVLKSPKEQARIKALAEKYSPYFRARYDSFLKNVSSGVFGERAASYGVKRWTDYGMAGIEYTDKLGGYVRWKAIELDMEESRPDLAKGSAEFYDEVALEWERMMYRTESTSHPMEMSDLTRMGRMNSFAAPFVMFQSAASKVYSNTRRAVIEWQNGDRRKAAIIAAGNVLSFAIIAGIRREWRAFMRDKDDEEERSAAMDLARAGVENFPLIGDTLSAALGVIDTGKVGPTGTAVDNFADAAMKVFGSGYATLKDFATDATTRDGAPKWHEDGLKALDGMYTAGALATGLPVVAKDYAKKASNWLTADTPEEQLEALLKERGLVSDPEEAKTVTAQRNRAYRAVLDDDARRFESAVRAMADAGGDISLSALARNVVSRYAEYQQVYRKMSDEKIASLPKAQMDALSSEGESLNRDLKTLQRLYEGLPKEIFERTDASR